MIRNGWKTKRQEEIRSKDTKRKRKLKKKNKREKEMYAQSERNSTRENGRRRKWSPMQDVGEGGNKNRC